MLRLETDNHELACFLSNAVREHTLTTVADYQRAFLAASARDDEPEAKRCMALRQRCQQYGDMVAIKLQKIIDRIEQQDPDYVYPADYGR